MTTCAVCYEESDDLTCAGCVSEATEDERDVSFRKGYDQAALEVLDEVFKRSPTMASDIMNRYPEWKALVQARRDQLTL